LVIREDLWLIKLPTLLASLSIGLFYGCEDSPPFVLARVIEAILLLLGVFVRPPPDLFEESWWARPGSRLAPLLTLRPVFLSFLEPLEPSELSLLRPDMPPFISSAGAPLDFSLVGCLDKPREKRGKSKDEVEDSFPAVLEPAPPPEIEDKPGLAEAVYF